MMIYSYRRKLLRHPLYFYVLTFLANNSNTSASLRSICVSSHIHFLILEFRFQHPVEIDLCRISDVREYEVERINDLLFRILQKCQLESGASAMKQTRSCLLWF